MYVWISPTWAGVKVVLKEDGKLYSVEVPEEYPRTLGSLLRRELTRAYGRHGHTLDPRPRAEDLNQALMAHPSLSEFKFTLADDSEEIEYTEVPTLAVP